MLSKKSRFVGGSLLMIVGYLPLINYVLLDNAILKSCKNHAKKINCFDEVSNDMMFGAESNAEFREISNFSDILCENCDNSLLFDVFSSNKITIDNENVEIPSLIALLETESPKSLDVSPTVPAVSKNVDNISKKTSNPSHIKVVSIGEHTDARMVKSKIKSNFYADARGIGIPASVVNYIIKTLSEKIDFRRSLKKGDKFEVLYNKKNEMLYTKITTKKGEFSVYKFANGKSSSYYFANGDKSGHVAQNNYFGLPLNGKPAVSDRFGWRRHPFSGQYHHHTGVDLRAPYGSPVFAIYEGIVTRASYYCGYGHCIDIKHSSGYSSRYAHLSKYSVRLGSKVKRGQIIGNVGSSGISTGPHLHLELAKNNTVLNPFSVKMIPIEKASVKDKYKFNILKKKISNIFSTI